MARLTIVSHNDSELAQKVIKQYERGGKIDPADLANLYLESAYKFIENETDIYEEGTHSEEVLDEKTGNNTLPSELTSTTDKQALFKEIVSRAYENPQLQNDKDGRIMTRSEMNKAAKKKATLEKISRHAAELLQTAKNGGIIADDDSGSTGGNGNGRLLNKRTVGRNAQEPTVGENVAETETTGNGSTAQVQSDVEGRTGGTAPQNQRRRTVKFKRSSVNYTEAAADNSNGYKAYSAFKNAGIKAVYCDGAIERTVGGETVTRAEAFVAPDGTVFVSNMSTLPAKETFDHERVHIEQRNDSAEYLEYEDILLQNADFDSVTYLDIAKQINENQFNGKYDVEDINNIPVFMREIVAYINQYVLSDPEYAEQIFGGMFTDWNAVARAVHNFNEEMGVQFDDTPTDERQSGGSFGELSKYFKTNDDSDIVSIAEVFNRFIEDDLSENDIEFISNNEVAKRLLQEFAGEISEINTTDTESAQERDAGEPLFREPSSQEIYRPRTNEDHFDYMTGHEVNSRMKQAESLVTKLGLELKWSEKTKRGYFDRKNNTVVLNPHMTATAMYVTILKHEFCHRLETKRLYSSFFRYVYEDSANFKEYCRQRYAKEMGREFDGTDGEAVQWAIKQTEDTYRKELPASERSKVDEYYAKQELLADFVGDRLLGGQDIESTMQALEELAIKKRNIVEQLRDFIHELIAKIKGDPHYLTMEQDLEYLNNYIGRVFNSAEKKTAAKDSGEIKYSLSENAESELHKALYDKNYRNEVLLRYDTPKIMLSQKGVKNHPMVMNASHIRENVFTEAEARSLGLKVDEHTHYHGIGEKYFLKIIDSLDNVKEAYRGTKNASDSSRQENYFLLVTEFKDESGNIINVPVYIDELAQCNRVFIETNKIATVFGREDFRNYIKRQVQSKNLVRIKNKSNAISEGDALIAPAYESTALDKSISTSNENVNTENNDIRQSLKEIKADFGDIDKFAGRILRQNRSSYDRAALTETLNEVLEIANDGDYGRAMNRAYAAARNIIDYSKDTEQIADDAQEILTDIRNTAPSFLWVL